MRRAAVLVPVLFLVACGSGGGSGSEAKNGPIAFITSPDVGISRTDSDGAVQRLTKSPDFYPTWSPDGTQIAFERGFQGEKSRLFVMRADGSELHQVGTVGTSTAGLSWNPEGDEIAFADTKGISVVKPDGTGLKRLTTGGEEPAWSPDGETIVFRRPPSLYAMQADGSDVHVLVEPAESIEHLYTLGSPAWSPDGKRIAFVRIDLAALFEPRAGTIEVANADGSGERTLTSISYVAAGDAASIRPAWSPDGRSIAFADEHRNGIWVVSPTGGKPRALYPDDSYYQPSWGPAGA
jgi:Tol biopolymer transport system component